MRESYPLRVSDPALVDVQCPYCGEIVEVVLEPDLEGTWVQDCEVCCNPWSVTRTRGGLRVERAQ